MHSWEALMKQSTDDNSIGARIRYARQKAGISQNRLAAKLGVSRNTVINWEQNRFRPETRMVPELCSFLSITVSQLFGDASENSISEQELINNYRQLSTAGQNIARKTIELILDEEIREKNRIYRENFALFELAPTKAAAGSGYDYVDLEPDYIFLRKNNRNVRADAVVEVSGDSMLPVYHDGDYVYVEYTSHAYPGEDVICTTADGGIIKRIAADGKLRSVNPALPYGDRSEDFNVRIIGRVLGVVSSSDMPDDGDSAALEELFADEVSEFRRAHGCE